VTQKLGGDAGITTSYTILISALVAVIAPLLLPIATSRHGMAFLPTFLLIIKKVFPILLAPLFLAWTIELLLPKIHRRILSIHNLAFYMWAVALALAISVTVRALYHSHVPGIHILGIALATLAACVMQFWMGKKIGSRYGLRMEGGQALGQKNTIFIIWLGYTFLSPISATAGGFYSIWHNVINSWQLYRHAHALPPQQGQRTDTNTNQ
jgi:BASS family bile acid:Na+ symporter